MQFENNEINIGGNNMRLKHSQIKLGHNEHPFIPNKTNPVGWLF